ncbi:MAG: hypothetical protein K8R75_02700 [Deltaproteobacteria bacterium]|nr:hypothetical protein [Deltaproteobacteria bacterium]
MERQMDWLLSIVRVAGASFPVASSLVQLQAEIDSKALLERVAKLEDPVSRLHDDVPELSRQIYRKLKLENSTKLDFDEEFYKKFGRALAVLESQGYIKGGHALGKNYAAGIRLVDPSYIMYLCAIEEDSEKMESLMKVVDGCKVGQWLDGNRIQIDLPLPVIKAVFDIYESKGYGLCSQEVGSCKYIGKA